MNLRPSRLLLALALIGFAPALQLHAQTLPSGTVAYYSFNDTLNDGSGQTNHLRVIPGGVLSYTSGRFNNALYLNGSTTLEMLSGLFPNGGPTGAAPYTVAAWVKADTGCPLFGGWLGYGNPLLNQGNNFRLGGASNNVLEYWYANDFSAILASGTFFDGFHAVVGTWDGTNEILYLDGVATQRSPNPTGLNVAATTFVVGKTTADVNFKGWVDDLLIVNRALTSNEIAAYQIYGAVLPAGPSLEVFRQGTNVVVSWPAITNSFGVQYSTDLSATSWTTLYSTTVISNRYYVTNTLGDLARYYRLISPCGVSNAPTLGGNQVIFQKATNPSVGILEAQYLPIDGTLTYTLDAVNFSDPASCVPGSLTYHWRIIADGISGDFTDRGITGYRQRVLTLYPNSLVSDDPAHLELTVTSTITGLSTVFHFNLSVTQSDIVDLDFFRSCRTFPDECTVPTSLPVNNGEET